MIAIFDKNGDRLSITWQGYEFNDVDDESDTFDGGQQEGCFMDAVTTSTPVNYQSEVLMDLLKQGGGIEYYNPRVASRVLNMNARLQYRDYDKLHEHLNYIQQLFSPLWLQYEFDGLPPSAGRPLWADPWDANFKGLKFTNLGDGTYNADLDGETLMQYAVAPLSLPDPVVAAIQTGWGARLELPFMILDGGVAIAQASESLSGNGTIDLDWSTVPVFPLIQFTMTGAGASNLTISIANADTKLPDGSIVIDASGLANTDVVTIVAKDREVYKNGVVDNTLLASAPTWPVLSPDETVTVTWTNTTNVTSNVVKYFETLHA